MEKDKLWWGSIPNARRFIDDIVSRTEKQESVVYNIDEFFPWKDTFTEMLLESVMTPDKSVNIIYDDETGDIAPGEYILNNYFRQDVRIKYRSSIGYEKFIAENDHSETLKNRIIIIRCKDESRFTVWFDFVTGYVKYHDPNAARCSFLIENCSGVILKSNFAVLSALDYLQQYDTDMFALLIATSVKSESRESALVKRYIAELASNIAGKDIEFAACLAAYGKRLVFMTKSVLKEALETQRRSNGSDFEINVDVNQKIREAQMKIFYPEIENFRRYFIQKNEDFFPSLSYISERVSRKVDNIFSLELGDLKFLCDCAYVCVSQEDHKEVKFYHRCRNKLSHIEILTENEVKKISRSECVDE